MGYKLALISKQKWVWKNIMINSIGTMGIDVTTAKTRALKLFSNPAGGLIVMIKCTNMFVMHVNNFHVIFHNDDLRLFDR